MDRIKAMLMNDKLLADVATQMAPSACAMAEGILKELRALRSDLTDTLWHLERNDLGQHTHMLWIAGHTTGIALVMQGDSIDPRIVRVHEASRMPAEVAKELAEKLNGPDMPDGIRLVGMHVIEVHKRLLAEIDARVADLNDAVALVRREFNLKPQGDQS